MPINVSFDDFTKEGKSIIYNSLHNIISSSDRETEQNLDDYSDFISKALDYADRRDRVIEEGYKEVDAGTFVAHFSDELHKTIYDVVDALIPFAGAIDAYFDDANLGKGINTVLRVDPKKQKTEKSSKEYKPSENEIQRNIGGTPNTYGKHFMPKEKNENILPLNSGSMEAVRDAFDYFFDTLSEDSNKVYLFERFLTDNPKWLEIAQHFAVSWMSHYWVAEDMQGSVNYEEYETYLDALKRAFAKYKVDDSTEGLRNQIERAKKKVDKVSKRVAKEGKKEFTKTAKEEKQAIVDDVVKEYNKSRSFISKAKKQNTEENIINAIVNDMLSGRFRTQGISNRLNILSEGGLQRIKKMVSKYATDPKFRMSKYRNNILTVLEIISNLL